MRPHFNYSLYLEIKVALFYSRIRFIRSIGQEPFCTVENSVTCRGKLLIHQRNAGQFGN